MDQEEPPYWPDLGGRFVGSVHIFAVRVYFEDTDFSGVVYHTSYLRWCERGRSDFMRLSGITHTELASSTTSEPSAFAVRRITADFVKPARIDDILEVHTEIAEITKASVLIYQKIVLQNKVIFNLTAQCVLISASGRVSRLPKSLYAMHKSY